MAELTIKHCNHALCLAQFGPSWAILYTQYTIGQLFVLHFTQFLAFKLAFTISAPVNGGMSDWFICVQILKLDIADIIEDYTDSIDFLSFELSAPLMLPVEA